MFIYRNGRRSSKKSRGLIGSLGRQLRPAGRARGLSKICRQSSMLIDNASSLSSAHIIKFKLIMACFGLGGPSYTEIKIEGQPFLPITLSLPSSQQSIELVN